MEESFSVKSGSLAGSNASSGTKRKRQTEAKFYAVRIGHNPGVYYTWNDCLEQVKGFKKALFKSFPTLTDAERYVAGDDPSQSNSTSSPPTKFYAVKSGRIPGIYTDWQLVQEQITGWQKPRHRSFSTRSEAQRFLDDDEQKSTSSVGAIPREGTKYFSSSVPGAPVDTSNEPRVLKKVKKAANGWRGAKAEQPEYNEVDFEPGIGPLPPGAEDGFDPNILLNPQTGRLVYKTQEQRQATKSMPGANSIVEPIRIFTDGSSVGNGKEGAHAGVGVYFGSKDKRNVSEPLPGPRQTNQRAELTAVMRALELAPRNRNIVIVSDSKYAIDCVTTWFINWRRNGWKNAAGKAVENKDLIENILSKIDERNRLRVRTEFEWVKGHAGDSGNQEADRLAMEGARSTHR